jgi:hypothetical protein
MLMYAGEVYWCGVLRGVWCCFPSMAEDGSLFHPPLTTFERCLVTPYKLQTSFATNEARGTLCVDEPVVCGLCDVSMIV